MLLAVFGSAVLGDVVQQVKIFFSIKSTCHKPAHLITPTKRPLRCILLLIFLFKSIHVFGGEEDTVSVKKIKIYPFPAVGYAPETRWYFGGVALFNMRFSNDSSAQTSTFETEINFTQNKQFILTANFDLQFFKNKFRVIGDNGYYKFPEDYWGIGNDTKESDKVKYDAKRLEFDNSFLYSIAPSLFAGIRQRYHQIELKETIPDTDLPLAGDIIRASGIGPRLLIDTRDNILNATMGLYISFGHLWFITQLGSDHNFSRTDGDIRFYKTVHRGGVLAFQSVISLSKNDPPFRMLPLLGSESIMRGYYQGRYRAEAFGALQAEYRLNIWNWIGAAFFGGAGKVSANPDEQNVIHPTYGAGLRIRIDKKENVNLRFDYAKGDYSDGFYISFGESF